MIKVKYIQWCFTAKFRSKNSWTYSWEGSSQGEKHVYRRLLVLDLYWCSLRLFTALQHLFYHRTHIFES